MTDRGTIHQVAAGPYMLELPANGVAILYEDGKQLPGGVGYLDALVQFAGEVIRLRSMIDTIRRDPEITDPRDPHQRDIVAELESWLALEHETAPSHTILKTARDEIVALRASLERQDRLVIQAVAVATPVIRAEALEEIAQIMDQHRGQVITGEFLAWAIRELKERRDE